MKKRSIDLGLVLPSEAGERDPCVTRLLDALRAERGIVAAHVDRDDDEKAAARLCVHFDPERLSIERVEELVRDAGAQLATRFAHLAAEVDGLRHERHARLVEGVLLRAEGVLHATVTFGTRSVAVEFDPRKTDRRRVLTELRKAGIRVRRSVVDHEHEEVGEREHVHGAGGARAELALSLVCGTATGLAWGAETFGVRWVPIALTVVAFGAGGWYTVQEALTALRARRFEIDFLMIVAAAGAAALGEWIEGGLLLFLFSLGHALEGYAMSRARDAIGALADVVPRTALRVSPEGGIEEIDLDELAIGDRVMIKPDTRVPADGIVALGTSSVDQAPVTGESVPADKRAHPDPAAALGDPARANPEHRVFAGTLNGSGALEVVVTRVASDSTLARVMKLVTEAQTERSPTQQLTDRFERVFVPIVLGVVGLLLFAWVVLDEPFSASFYRAMAVLVAASPCALAIATPSAVLSGVARAARGGVLVKGGAHLEALGAIEAIAFDKTGTLTEGRPRLTDVAPADGVDEQTLLATALAVESHSDHPLARAIVEGTASRLSTAPPTASVVRSVIGFGVEGTVAGERVSIGKPGLFERDGGSLPDGVARRAVSLEQEGRTVMIVRRGSRFLGALGVMDTPRSGARAVIDELSALGVRRSVLLTGDNARVGAAVGEAVGISDVRGDLLPEDKVRVVQELARTSKVAMVGDGVNDAPALAKATIGVAMGAGGSDVALETADVALMGDDLTALPFAVRLGRRCRAVIRQNLWISLGMVAILVPATLSGIAGIAAAVAFHEGSTLVVVANALRLLAHRDGRGERRARRHAHQDESE